MTVTVRIGFIPLVDAALLVAASELGFAEHEGLHLDLVREVSWANIRDKLNLGYFDAAHMLAPAAIASSLGLGHVRVNTIAPVALGLNGNAITVSRGLHAMLGEAGDGDLADPAVSSRALSKLVRERARNGQAPLTFGHVFPFSSHHYQLRLWMQAGGVDPGRDVNLVVLPPPFMVQSLESGHLDGFCVGAPWNSLAVQADIGRILHFGTDIRRNCPEKVLGIRAEWDRANSEVTNGLVRAIATASRWCDDPTNFDELAGLLARSDVLGVPREIVRRIVAGNLAVAPGVVRSDRDYLVLRPGAIRPDPADAGWLFEQMVAAGQAAASDAGLSTAMAVYRPDRFDGATGAG